jgi:hypothetical protein
VQASRRRSPTRGDDRDAISAPFPWLSLRDPRLAVVQASSIRVFRSVPDLGAT